MKARWSAAGLGAARRAVLPNPAPVDAISLFRQERRGAPFRLLRRYALSRLSRDRRPQQLDKPVDRRIERTVIVDDEVGLGPATARRLVAGGGRYRRRFPGRGRRAAPASVAGDAVIDDNRHGRVSAARLDRRPSARHWRRRCDPARVAVASAPGKP